MRLAVSLVTLPLVLSAIACGQNANSAGDRARVQQVSVSPVKAQLRDASPVILTNTGSQKKTERCIC